MRPFTSTQKSLRLLDLKLPEKFLTNLVEKGFWFFSLIQIKMQNQISIRRWKATFGSPSNFHHYRIRNRTPGITNLHPPPPPPPRMRNHVISRTFSSQNRIPIQSSRQPRQRSHHTSINVKGVSVGSKVRFIQYGLGPIFFEWLDKLNFLICQAKISGKNCQESANPSVP